MLRPGRKVRVAATRVAAAPLLQNPVPAPAGAPQGRPRAAAVRMRTAIATVNCAGRGCATAAKPARQSLPHEPGRDRFGRGARIGRASCVSSRARTTSHRPRRPLRFSGGIPVPARKHRAPEPASDHGLPCGGAPVRRAPQKWICARTSKIFGSSARFPLSLHARMRFAWNLKWSLRYQFAPSVQSCSLPPWTRPSSRSSSL